MKIILSALLFCTFLSNAQELKPRFENDTLYTLSGYKIFSGSVIEFANGLERYDRFKYVSVKTAFFPHH